MIVSGVMAQQPLLVLGGGALWTPLNMATVPQIYLDAQDSVVTNVSGACSAISNLGAMAANGDFSQGTAGSRPAILVAELNAKRVLRFDATDDILRSTAIGARDLYRGIRLAYGFAVYKKRATDPSPVSRCMFQSTIGTGTSSRFAMSPGFGVSGTQNAPTMLGRAFDGEAQSALYNPSPVSGQYTMVLVAFHTLDRWGRIYVDGALSVENSAFIAASYSATSNTAAQLDLSIGGFSSGSGYADIDLAAMVCSGGGEGSLPTSDIDKLFGWAAHKYGLTANLPGGHPYKTVAPTV